MLNGYSSGGRKPKFGIRLLKNSPYVFAGLRVVLRSIRFS
jgi:hypothetical protein